MERQVRDWGLRHQPRLKPICALLLTIIAGWQAEARAGRSDEVFQVAQTEFAQVEFESGFLSGGAAIDVSRYERGNVVRPGAYTPDIYVDGRWVGRVEVTFEAAPGTPDAQPCFDRTLLDRIGVDRVRLPQDIRASLEPEGACMRIGQIIPEASVSFEFGDQRLDLSIPQIAMLRSPRGYVSPDQWTAGVPVAMLGYNVNTYHSQARGGYGSTQGYVGLDAGFNVQRWHFRHSGSFGWDDRGERRYQNTATYVQRDVAAWSSQLVVGDTYTSGDLFDSTSFRGVRLYTDDRMLPESQRGYAPVVRGVANSNAKVTITQNGMRLYETTVAPGAFIIDDLYPTGYGGDLHVTVTEADGSVHSFSVPFAAIPLSLRPGQNRYSFTAGVVRNLDNTSPPFMQATWQHGFTNTLTGYGGVTVAQGYLSAMLGGVLNTSLGAFGADVTQATTQVPGERRYSGQSFRVSYAKTIAATGTNIAIAAYRYSTNGFFGLTDAMRARDQAAVHIDSARLYRQRNRASLTLSQQFGNKWGSVSATASAATYWNRGGSDLDYTVGYNNTFRTVSYGISAARQRNALAGSSTTVYAGLSIPLGRARPALLSTNVNHDSRGSTQWQTNLSGSVGADGNLAYGVNLMRGTGSGSAQTSGSANLTYRGARTELSGSVGVSNEYQQYSVALRGAVVAHPGGVTLSQPVGETFAIVAAPHAAGAHVTNATGVRLDRNGYAVVPYLSPFALNDITLDPKGLSTDIELLETRQRVAPLAGAVPMLRFRTVYGRSAVIRARQPDGSPLPFGAMVKDRNGADVGMVGQGGKIFARGLADHGELSVTWGAADAASACHLSYALPVRKRSAGYQPPQSLDLPCVAAPGVDYAPKLSGRAAPRV
ncbi:fimbrial biogenesis outer membrane usher protein [Burkholderia pseudomultivorans]|uniref:fimbria/pilus outer membrane usher protein n=1 Tax=Burkholderia pseudomultivorans TaxID=1207504 RepID=UPI002875EC5A|nr:fimbria/pilus outer membrane usher protein [Burkholderia pseudomultivorans]MDS0793912.1 fimbrial biogenesis outer membrane usher protein [Burkholderia pseudomultivorans]